MFTHCQGEVEVEMEVEFVRIVSKVGVSAARLDWEMDEVGRVSDEFDMFKMMIALKGRCFCR